MCGILHYNLISKLKVTILRTEIKNKKIDDLIELGV
jgi:hypothetical protein